MKVLLNVFDRLEYKLVFEIHFQNILDAVSNLRDYEPYVLIAIIFQDFSENQDVDVILGVLLDYTYY